jgi:hypothetical protein
MRRLALLFAALTAPAAAQDIYSGGINNSWTSSQLLLNADKGAWAASECIDPARWATSCGTPRPNAASPTVPIGDAKSLGFKRSTLVTRQSEARFLDQTRRVNPGGLGPLQQLLAQDVIRLIATAAKPYGLTTDNVADAMAIYAMEAWEVIAGDVLPPSRARGLAVRAQMARAIAATPDFLRASDAEKQLIADEMLYYAALANAGMQGARAEGPAVVKQWQAAARQGARRALGMDLAAMTLTDEGLRFRR